MSQNDRLFADIIRALSIVIDYDEGHLLYHGWRVGVMTHLMAKRMELADSDMLYYAGLLHDIGAMGLKSHVIHYARNGFSDPESLQHSFRGARILQPLGPLAPLGKYLLAHHEHYDGSGFPEGIGGGDVPIEAYLINLADKIDLEITAHASDHGAAKHKAIESIRKHRGVHWPAEAADAALDMLTMEDGLVRDLLDEPSLRERIYAFRHVPEKARNMSRSDLLSQLLWTLARMIDAKHSYTMGHSTRVAFFGFQIARELGQDQINPWDVLWAGMLHDVGKVGTPRALLDKNWPLDTREWKVVKKHADDTFDIVSTIQDLSYLARPAASHHERYGGNGYPFGKKGEEIPLLGRILTFADTYDACTTDRAYRKTLGHRRAMEIIKLGNGSQFDPNLYPIAKGVLDEIGPSITELPESMEGFYKFFDLDTPDVRLLLGRNMKESYRLVESDKGVEIAEVDAWSRILLGEDLKVQNCDPKTAELFGAEPHGDFLGCVNEIDGHRLQGAIGAMEIDKPHSDFILTKAGNHHEVLIVKRQQGAEIFFRRSDHGMHSFKKRALLYKNFMMSSDGVLFTDPDGVILDVNQAFLDLYGYEREEVIGETPRLIVPPGGPEETYSKIRAAMIDPRERTWRGEIRTIARGLRPIDAMAKVNSIRDSSGRVTGYVAAITDITEMKKMEEALRASEERYRVLTQTAYDAIISCKAGGEIISWNRGARVMFEKGPERMLGRGIESLIAGYSDDFKHNIIESMKQDEGRKFELIALRPGGGEFPVEVSLANWEAGGEPFFTCIFRDITERRQAEEQLEKKDRELQEKNKELEALNQLKSDLMAITSHDLKAPLGAIVNYAYLAREKLGEDMAARGKNLGESEAGADPDSRVDAYLANIEDAGRRMASFISEMLDLEKINSGNLEINAVETDLLEVLKTAVRFNEPAAARKDISIALEVEGSPRPLLADRVRMEQVFNNLISNAVKFSGPGAEITARYADQAGGSVTIQVLDRGPGLPGDDLEAVFDRYFQVREKRGDSARNQGAGLGLYIVKNIVELHRGEARAENREGGGAVFTVTLPARYPEPAGRELVALVIDPDRSLRPALERPLAKKKVVSFYAGDAREADNYYRYEKPDIIFVNSDRLDGEALEFVREKTSGNGSGPAAVAVGDDDPRDADGLFHDRLFPPLLESEVFELIASLALRRKTAGPGAAGPPEGIP